MEKENNGGGIDTRPLMVSIHCLTYNHEPYIRQCLDGFVMQRTNFRFEAVVHDDASTDGTADIVRKYAERYPDIIKPIYETENQYSKRDGSLGRIMNEACKGKYIAYCEGDDYWTDPLKLQKQVDLMEAHPDCSLTYHACKNEFDNVDEGQHFGELVKSEYEPIEILDYPFQTATVMVRSNIIKSELYRKAQLTICVSGDMMLFLTASRQGRVLGVNEQMSVYRRQPNSISRKMRNMDVIFNHYKSWNRASKLFGPEVRNAIVRKILYADLLECIHRRDLYSSTKIVFYASVTYPLVLLLVIKCYIKKVSC